MRRSKQVGRRRLSGAAQRATFIRVTVAAEDRLFPIETGHVCEKTGAAIDSWESAAGGA